MSASDKEKRVVLIDDNASFRLILSQVAQMRGMILDTYESLSDLGSIGLLGRYDAAIIDYDLDKMTGVEIAEYLEAFFSDVPVILVSGAQRDPDKKGWPASVKRFVHKDAGYDQVLSQAMRCIS